MNVLTNDGAGLWYTTHTVQLR